MVFMPIGDDNSDRTRFPVLNLTLVALNVLVFVLFQGLGSNLEFTYALSVVPAEIVSGDDVITPNRTLVDPATSQRIDLPGLQPTPFSVYVTLLTAMFMHGGFAHLFGNMLFLWIFGDNLEDRLGRARYLVFYLVCGLAASLSHVASTLALGQDPLVPSLGASGAISGVLAGYLLLFPRRRVRVLLLRMITEVPAMMALGMWFVFQLVMGVGSLGAQGGGGVAYAAHIGGFLCGLAVIKLFDPGAATGAVRRVGRRYPGPTTKAR